MVYLATVLEQEMLEGSYWMALDSSFGLLQL
jgi:hypothetical protein